MFHYQPTVLVNGLGSQLREYAAVYPNADPHMDVIGESSACGYKRRTEAQSGDAVASPMTIRGSKQNAECRVGELTVIADLP